MDEIQPSGSAHVHREELLYFWALGDLHFYAHPAWQAIHTPRMSQMFQDLRQLWRAEGAPTFCVSPGDIVELAEPEHYQFARAELAHNLNRVPFYPGLGNHELWSFPQESTAALLEDFTTFWEQPARYYWVEGEVLCVMLDVIGYAQPVLTDESLAFLETALAKHPHHLALIFSHCPLYSTVLDRDPVRDLDYDSQEPFFYLENSEQVRAVLARHKNASLYFSGHTHAGWQSPQLVFTEQLGGRAFTHVNLSSPWYTGKHHGIAWLGDGKFSEYRPDEPDVSASWAVRVARNQVTLSLRDHQAGSWLARWVVPTSQTL
ncbi:MAG TPA: metallophosphoesterase [Ktedonobacteraceae bacterium]|nr:metallophosphoesterase [Ktedonobacteraceae bacterium]